MRFYLNLLSVTLIYAAVFFGAYLLVHSPSPVVSAEVSKWLWGPSVLVIGALSNLAWKIHEVKRAEGLKQRHKARLAEIVSALQRRMYAICVITTVGAIIGLVAPYIVAAWQVILVCMSISGVFGSLLLALVLYPITQKNIQEFEDAARLLVDTESAQKGLLEKLKPDQRKGVGGAGKETPESHKK